MFSSSKQLIWEIYEQIKSNLKKIKESIKSFKDINKLETQTIYRSRKSNNRFAYKVD